MIVDGEANPVPETPLTTAVVPARGAVTSTARSRTTGSRRGRARSARFPGGDGDLDRRGVLMSVERFADGIEVEAMRDERLSTNGAALEQAQRLAELVLIDHRARDRHLAPYHGEERDGCRLVGQSGQHDTPARAHQRERVLDRRRRPGRLDDEIDP